MLAEDTGIKPTGKMPILAVQEQDIRIAVILARCIVNSRTRSITFHQIALRPDLSLSDAIAITEGIPQEDIRIITLNALIQRDVPSLADFVNRPHQPL